MSLFSRARVSVPCVIEVEHTQERLHAHVALEGDLAIGPGDKVRVHGAPVRVSFGERIRLERLATVERATWLERIWTRAMARLELAELYEVSFTARRF